MIARDEIEMRDSGRGMSEAVSEVVPMQRRRGTAHVLLNHHGLLVGGSICVILLVLAIFAPLLSTADPKAISMTERLSGPSSTHLMGTDHLGRDIWSRVLYGARASMFVGLSVAANASLAGIIVGLLGGYNRRFGNLLMRLVDGLLAFPGIVLALALIAVLGSRLSNVIIALSIVYLPRVARIMHGVVLELREREYITAATAMGAKTSRILVRHILPNSLGPTIVQGSFIFASAIITEASLSFLGLGLPPGTASWGSILSEGRKYMLGAPWITLFPGAAIFVAVMGLNLLGDSVRDLIDPRLRGPTGHVRGDSGN